MFTARNRMLRMGGTLWPGHRVTPWARKGYPRIGERVLATPRAVSLLRSRWRIFLLKISFDDDKQFLEFIAVVTHCSMCKIILLVVLSFRDKHFSVEFL